jgi:MFS family permease
MKLIQKSLLVGILATMVMDLLNRFIASFGIISVSHYGSIGRIFSNWFRGDFIHAGFGALSRYPNEYAVGLLVHYAIGTALAGLYLAAAPKLFRSTPDGLIPVLYGLGTSVFAWFWMFPSVGLGLFGLHAPPAMHLFRTSLLNHLSFGLGIACALRLGAYLASWGREDLDRARLPLKRTKLGITMTLSLSSAGFSIAFMLGSLTMIRMTGGDNRFSGAAAAILLLSASLATYPAGVFRDRYGQKALLLLATALGICAGIAGAMALAMDSLAFLCAYLCLMGSTHGIILMGRYAVAGLAPQESRAKHMSHVIMGSTVGAIGGPLLISVGGSLEGAYGLVPGIASLLLTILFYLIAMSLLSLLLRTEFFDSGPRSSKPGQPAYSFGDFFAAGKIRFAMVSMVASQLAMVTAMAVTPAHMHAHHHAMGSISMVLSLHFIGMYGLSFFPGMLADRFGREVVIVLGGILLAGGALLGISAAGLPSVAGALFLLGLGWNFCFLSSSVLIADTARGKNIGRIQGLNEFFVNLSSSLASLGTGLVLAGFGFGGLLAVSLCLALVPMAGYAFLSAGRRAQTRVLRPMEARPKVEV